MPNVVCGECLSSCGGQRANRAFPRAEGVPLPVRTARQSPDCLRVRPGCGPLLCAKAARLRARCPPRLARAHGVAVRRLAPPPRIRLSSRTRHPSADTARRAWSEYLPSRPRSSRAASAACGRRIALWPRSPPPLHLRAVRPVRSLRGASVAACTACVRHSGVLRAFLARLNKLSAKHPAGRASEVRSGAVVRRREAERAQAAGRGRRRRGGCGRDGRYSDQARRAVSGGCMARLTPEARTVAERAAQTAPHEARR